MDQQSFLFQALVYLAAAVLLVPFSKKLGLGSVIGYLLAGVIIGPAVLGICRNRRGRHYALRRVRCSDDAFPDRFRN